MFIVFFVIGLWQVEVSDGSSFSWKNLIGSSKLLFGGIMLLLMWLLTSAGHILLPIVMRSFIIFGKVGEENSGLFSHSRIGVIPKICVRKSMMLHGAVWRDYVHLWVTYMKLLVWQVHSWVQWDSQSWLGVVPTAVARFVIISMAQKNMFCGIALHNFRYLINQITSWSVS